jgi:hypothetical protein
MNQIICFVNDDEKEVFKEKLSSVNEIFFAKNLDEFNSRLTDTSMPIISLNNTNENNSKNIGNIIKTHRELNFYILDKKNRITENYEFDVLRYENVGVSPYPFREILEEC